MLSTLPAAPLDVLPAIKPTLLTGQIILIAYKDKDPELGHGQPPRLVQTQVA